MALQIVMPKLGMIMTEGKVEKWLKAPGQPVRKGDMVVEVSTEKITYQVEAPGDGILHSVASEGATLLVGAVIAVLLAPGEAPPAAVAAAPAAQVHATPQAARAPAAVAGEEVRASPAARRLARELGVDLAQVRGSGPGGRIMEEDVQKFADSSRARPAPAPSAPTAAPTPPYSRALPLVGMRRIIAQRMMQSLQTSAQLTFTLDVDMTEALRLRREAADRRIRVTDIIVKAAAEALKRHPEINVTLVGDEVRFLSEINIGVAVSLRDGLVVPVVRHADAKTLAEIAAATTDLLARARAGKLTLDDFTGGTFTVSVLGVVDAFTPILNTPESALLGVGRIADKPAAHKGQIALRKMATLSLTVDHRVIDGAPAASFLRRLRQLLEAPGVVFGLAQELPAEREEED